MIEPSRAIAGAGLSLQIFWVLILESGSAIQQDAVRRFDGVNDVLLPTQDGALACYKTLIYSASP
jgi:hypothetical protein